MSESAAMRSWDSAGFDVHWLRGDPMQLSGMLHDPHRLDGGCLGDGPLLPVAADGISIG